MDKKIKQAAPFSRERPAIASALGSKVCTGSKPSDIREERHQGRIFFGN